MQAFVAASAVEQRASKVTLLSVCLDEDHVAIPIYERGGRKISAHHLFIPFVRPMLLTRMHTVVMPGSACIAAIQSGIGSCLQMCVAPVSIVQPAHMPELVQVVEDCLQSSAFICVTCVCPASLALNLCLWAACIKTSVTK